MGPGRPGRDGGRAGAWAPVVADWHRQSACGP